MIYSTGVCKSFPPPLVRGGVFLVGSDTKYRDIADGNHNRAEGNSAKYNTVRYQVPRYSGWKHDYVLQTEVST